MSGCATGSGDVRDGPGILGLTEAWLMAGARAIISTGWPGRRQRRRIFWPFLSPLENRTGGGSPAPEPGRGGPLGKLAERAGLLGGVSGDGGLPLSMGRSYEEKKDSMSFESSDPARLPNSLPENQGASATEFTDSTSPEADAYSGWVDLVGRIHSGEIDGMAELYHLFSKGIRFYLCRQLGPQELDDKIHDTFVVVVQAIRRGEIREPQRLMGFVRTIVRRQVAAHIDRVVHTRREQMELDATVRVPDPRGNPEEAAMFSQREDLVRRILGELSDRDREILTRFLPARANAGLHL